MRGPVTSSVCKWKLSGLKCIQHVETTALCRPWKTHRRIWSLLSFGFSSNWWQREWNKSLSTLFHYFLTQERMLLVPTEGVKRMMRPWLLKPEIYSNWQKGQPYQVQPMHLHPSAEIQWSPLQSSMRPALRLHWGGLSGLCRISALSQAGEIWTSDLIIRSGSKILRSTTERSWTNHTRRDYKYKTFSQPKVRVPSSKVCRLGAASKIALKIASPAASLELFWVTINACLGSRLKLFTQKKISWRCFQNSNLFHRTDSKTLCCKQQGFAGVLKNLSWHLDFVKGLIIDIPWFRAGKLSTDYDANKRIESPIAQADAAE